MMRLSEEILSDSMEMYLVTISRLRESGQPVPLSHIAETLSVTSVSVNEMCRKLQDQGYLVYRPYQGALLTEAGEKLANDTLRRHRLLEVFLVYKLGVDYPEAHEIACQMEHATTDQVIDRLDQFLGFPSVNPIGYPIPDRPHKQHLTTHIPLIKLPVGDKGTIIEALVSDSVKLFLRDAGLIPGKEVSLIGIGNHNYLVQINQEFVTLSEELAQAILVDLIVA